MTRPPSCMPEPTITPSIPEQHVPTAVAVERKEAWVQYIAPINQETVARFISEVNGLVNQGFARVNVLLASPGGSVMHGVAVYNFLRSIPVEIAMYNFGRIDSIAAVIFVGAEQRFAVPNSAFLIHGVSITLPNAQTFDETKLEEILLSVKKDRENIANILAERSGKPLDFINGLMIKGATMNASQALECGLIQAVKMVSIPSGARFIAIN